MTDKKQGIYLRAHTTVIDKQKETRNGSHRPHATKEHPKWAKRALVFDCETRTDVRQELTFGFYRILQSVDNDGDDGCTHKLVEEGAFYDDDLPADERAILESYVGTADTDVVTFPPQFPLYSRSEFVKEVFYKLAQRGALIVGFNICFDLARLARKWNEGLTNEWSLTLSEFPDGEETFYHPRVTITPIDSKKAFIGFWQERIPKKGKIRPTQIGDARFLDLRTSLWSLFNKALSLKSACQLEAFARYNLPQKIEHKPTGRVTLDEIKYARHDTRCTAALLNAFKKEFDLHTDIELDPDKSFSPASIAKAYLS